VAARLQVFPVLVPSSSSIGNEIYDCVDKCVGIIKPASEDYPILGSFKGRLGEMSFVIMLYSCGARDLCTPLSLQQRKREKWRESGGKVEGKWGGLN
jgi:hypothetical protein